MRNQKKTYLRKEKNRTLLTLCAHEKVYGVLGVLAVAYNE